MKPFLYGVLGVLVALALVGAGVGIGAKYVSLAQKAEAGAAAFNFLQQNVKPPSAPGQPVESPPKPPSK